MTIVAALFATGQLLYKKKTILNYLYALGTYLLSYVLFYLWAVQTEAIRNFPILIYSDIPVTFIIAPTIYFAFRMSITGKQEKPASVLPHYIPAGCAASLVLIHNIQVVLPRMTNGVLISSHLADPQIEVLSLASDLFLFVYVLAANKKALQIYRDSRGKTRKRLRTVRTFLLSLLAASTVMLTPYIVREEWIFALGSFLFGITVIIFVLVFLSTPGSGSMFWFGMKPHKSNTLKNIDADELVKKLEYLMAEQHLYTDPNLSLGSLSKKMRLSPHQLSQLINQMKGMNFRTYINLCRIKSVQKDLIDYPGKTILEIALENGFNSKTTFNTEFVKISGKSPRSYRSMEGKKQKPDIPDVKY